MFCWHQNVLHKETTHERDLAEGLDDVMECVPEKKPKKPRNPTGKQDGVAIEGVDNYGFIHI